MQAQSDFQRQQWPDLWLRGSPRAQDCEATVWEVTQWLWLLLAKEENMLQEMSQGIHSPPDNVLVWRRRAWLGWRHPAGPVSPSWSELDMWSPCARTASSNWPSAVWRAKRSKFVWPMEWNTYRGLCGQWNIYKGLCGQQNIYAVF